MAEATGCRIAGVAGALAGRDRTVMKLIEQGVLRARLASPPKSLRPRYRLPTEEVLAYRNGYNAFRSPRTTGGEASSATAAQRRVSAYQLARARQIEGA
jgi:hypothetical protein